MDAEKSPYKERERPPQKPLPKESAEGRFALNFRSPCIFYTSTSCLNVFIFFI